MSTTDTSVEMEPATTTPGVRDALTGGGGQEASQPSSPPAYTRLKYAWFILIGFVFCLLMKDGMWGALHAIPFLRHGCDISDKVPGHEQLRNMCLGHTIVYRVTFCLFVFFAAHYVLASDLTCCLEPDSRLGIQNSYFCMKTAFLSLLFTLTLFIDNSVWAIWAEACIVGAAIFLLMQIVILIDFAYSWNELWASKEATKWSYYLLICSGAMYVFAIVLNSLMFVWFVPAATCSLNSAAVTITLLAGIFTFVVAIYVPHGSLLPSGLIFAYTAVQCFSALQAYPGAECNTLYKPTEESGLSKELILSSLFIGITLTYTSLSAGGSRRAFSMNPDARNPDDDDFSEHGYCFLHGVMMAASMYMCMVLTSWGDDRGQGRIDNSIASMWVKLVTEWVTISVYLWSLLAPYYCCKGRDFGIDT